MLFNWVKLEVNLTVMLILNLDLLIFRCTVTCLLLPQSITAATGMSIG